MEPKTRAKLVLTGGICVIGVALFLILTIYPMRYDPIGSAVLVCVLVAFAVVEIVLEDATFGLRR